MRHTMWHNYGPKSGGEQINGLKTTITGWYVVHEAPDVAVMFVSIP